MGKKRILRLLAAFLLTGSWALPALDGSELARQIASMKAGGLLEIPDGDYADVLARLGASGTGERKTILRAAHAGKARFTGMSALTVEASDVDLIGLRFEDGGIPQGRKNILEVKGDRVRIAECSFVDYNRGGGGKQWVRLSGKFNAFESNYLAGKTTVDPTLQVEVSSNEPNDTAIRWNHFGPRPPLGQNGGETIRIGYSQQAFFISRTLVQENLFEACDGEVEIISCKSGENFFYSNTFLRCAGALTLRHGNGSVVRGNVFLGNGKKESAGIRVIGAGHRIENNHFEGLTKDLCALSLTASQENFAAAGYWTVTNVVFRSNTVGPCAAPAVHFSAMFGGKGGSQSVLPSRCLFDANVFAPGGAAFTGTPGEGHRFTANRVGALPADFPGVVGITVQAVPFIDRGSGPRRPEGYPPLKTLTRAEVGPGWRNGR
jgi:poly(beta-D-mannuronate) lyase